MASVRGGSRILGRVAVGGPRRATRIVGAPIAARMGIAFHLGSFASLDLGEQFLPFFARDIEG